MRQTQVLVASEYAPARRLLTDLVSSEAGFKVAGEASSDVEARNMAKKLQPDVVLMDFRLPYRMGYDEVRLSRVGGLDSAMAIKDEVPGARVVLLANLDSVAYRDSNLQTGCLATDSNGIKAVFSLSDLCCGTVTNGGPMFANIEFRERVAIGNVGGGTTYGDFFGGGRSVMGKRAAAQTPGETLMVIGAAMLTFSVLFFALVMFSPLLGANPYVGIFALLSTPFIFLGGVFALAIGFFWNRKDHNRGGFIKA